MATYDRNLGVWRASDGSSGFASQEEAEAYESTGVRTPANDTSEFGDVYTQIVQQAPEGRAPVRTAPVDQSERYYDPTVSARATLNNDAVGDYYAAKAAADQKAAHDAMVERTGGTLGDLGRLAGYTAGAVTNPIGFVAGDYIPDAAQAVLNPVGYFGQQGINQVTGLLPGGNGLGTGSSNPPQNTAPTAADGSLGIRTPSRPDTTGAGGTDTGSVPSDVQDNVDSDKEQRDNDRVSLSDLYNDSKYDGSPEADESRRNQQAALGKQVELYDLLAKFDPDAYAKKASDLAMSNELALARSQVGAAAGAEGLFQAQEQAPTIQASARRDADAQQLQRQQLAAQVTGQMGDLATSTRGQDIGEAQAKSEFGVRIADGISQVTGLDWQLDDKETETLANVALALDAQNIDWARLDLDSQIAEVNRILGEAGLSQQWRIFQAGQKLTTKDLYGGLLSILGTGASGLFQIEAAKAGKK